MNLISVADAAKILRSGGVVAYPTEYCYGLGCDPKNHAAIQRILYIKRRNSSKGLILIADNISRMRWYFDYIPIENSQEVFSGWPGPNTWLLPAKAATSRWLRGNFNAVAIRITKHSQSRLLCREAGMAIVSTSANRSGRASLRTAIAVYHSLGYEVDGIVDGTIGNARSPSVIRDSMSGQVVRA